MKNNKHPVAVTFRRSINQLFFVYLNFMQQLTQKHGVQPVNFQKMTKILIKLLCLLAILAVIVAGVSGTLSPSSKQKNKAKGVKEFKINEGPVAESVFDRGLISEEPSSKNIIVEGRTYYGDTSLRNFNGTVLGYVTPVNLSLIDNKSKFSHHFPLSQWNNHGYDVAKIFGPKFDLISPVWLQILRKGDLQYELMGTHDVDPAWMKNVRTSGNDKTKSK